MVSKPLQLCCLAVLSVPEKFVQPKDSKTTPLLHKQCTSLAVPGESLLRAAFLNNLMSFISQSLLEHKAEATKLQEGQASG